MLAGYFGFGNLGDEAILHVAVRELRRLLPEAELIAVSGSPTETRRHHRVRAVPYEDMAGLIAEIERADLVLMPGGGLFHDHFGFDPSEAMTHRPSGLAFTITFPFLASILGRPVQLNAMGVGPLSSEAARELTRRAFELADAATVRDSESREVLVTAGVDEDLVSVSADPAYLLRPSGSGMSRWLPDGALGPGPLIGVCLREWDTGVDGDHWPREVAAALDDLIERDGAQVMFIPFQSVDWHLTDDRKAAAQVRDAMRNGSRTHLIEGAPGPAQVAAILGRCHVVLGMRLHAGILAALSGVPTVGLVYDAKVRSALKQLGMAAYALDMADATGNGLAALLRECLARRPELGAQLKAAVSRQRALALADLERAAELARGIGSRTARQLDPEFLRQTLIRVTARSDEQVRAAQAELTAASGELATLHAREAAASSELALARERHAEAAAELAVRSAEVTELRRELAEAAEELAVRSAEVTELRSELAEAAATSGALEADLVAAASQIEQLSEAVAYNERWLAQLYRSRGWRLLKLMWAVRGVARPASWLRALRRRTPDGRRIAMRAYVGIRPAARAILPARARHRLRPWAERHLVPAPMAPPVSRPLAEAIGQPVQGRAEATEGVGSWEGQLRMHRAIEPLVSVLLPVYNHADMLLRAARSVLRQSHRHLELIVIDDGSTDEIEPVLAQLLADTRVRVLRQPNQKLPRALTHASKVARGDFITWTSADNLMEPRMIETLLETLLQHPDTVLAYADVALIGADGRPLLDRSYRSQNLDPVRPDIVRLPRTAEALGLEADNFINASFLYRADAAAALEGHYADDLRGLEDYDFWLRLQRAGVIRHAENEQPLYAYRVHERTMSNDLLTRERDAHLVRGQALMRHEAARRAHGRQRWTLVPQLEGIDLEHLRAAAADLPVDVDASAAGRGEDGAPKRLRVISSQVIDQEPPYIRALPEAWQLVWSSPWNGERRWLIEWKGRDIDPLVAKARYTTRNPWELGAVGDRVVIGCHMPLAAAGVDVERARATMLANPQRYFVFLTTGDERDAALAKQLVARIGNAVYLGHRAERDAYQTYACVDAFWVPPLVTAGSEYAQRAALLLGYGAARPVLVPLDQPPVAAPYQLWYRPGESLGPLDEMLRGLEIDPGVCDRYLSSWSRGGALARVLRLADAATQEGSVERPRFAEPAGEATPASDWRPPGLAPLRRHRAALLVDSLDRGGLEEVVVQLASDLSTHSVDTVVVCAQRGGLAAERLAADGRRVYVANGDDALLDTILAEERPDIISSHYASLPALEAAQRAGVEVVETIHNTYAWLDSAGWQAERARSAHFDRAIAVSDLVQRYYERWNQQFEARRITVVPNFVDPSAEGASWTTAREALEVEGEDFVFLWAASYDARKNQLGLLAAFDEVARTCHDVRLICMGNRADPIYHQRLVEARAGLASAERIELRDYHENLPSILPGADAFVVPSFFEGWSVAATQALAAGVPLIHTDSGSGKELVGADGERGILVPNPGGDPVALAWSGVERIAWREDQPNRSELVAAMHRLSTERAAWKQRRDAIAQQARTEFGPDASLERYRMVLAGSDEREQDSPPDFASELAFWERELALEGDYAAGTLDRSLPELAEKGFPAKLAARVADLRRELGRPPDVLDVGSGPISQLAHGHRQGLLRLTAVDPLAREYQRFLGKMGYASEGLRAGRGEDLSALFGEEVFDLVWCQNALDHTEDPRRVLIEMTRVLRPGGLLWVSTWTREASAQGHGGLHQHDLVWSADQRLVREPTHMANGDTAGQPLDDGLPLEIIEAPATTEERSFVQIVWRKADARARGNTATARVRRSRAGSG